MAIAPLSYEEWGIGEPVRTPVRDRSHLRVVPEGGFQGQVAQIQAQEASIATRRTPLQRLEARRVIRRRRQVLAGALVVLASLVTFAATGGHQTAAAQLVGSNAPGAAVGIYTVQPGDTVASIAKAHASGPAVGQLERAIQVAVGSNTVVPGETINLNP